MSINLLPITAITPSSNTLFDPYLLWFCYHHIDRNRRPHHTVNQVASTRATLKPIIERQLPASNKIQEQYKPPCTPPTAAKWWRLVKWQTALHAFISAFSTIGPITTIRTPEACHWHLVSTFLMSFAGSLSFTALFTSFRP